MGILFSHLEPSSLLRKGRLAPHSNQKAFSSVINASFVHVFYLLFFLNKSVFLVAIVFQNLTSA